MLRLFSLLPLSHFPIHILYPGLPPAQPFFQQAQTKYSLQNITSPNGTIVAELIRSNGIRDGTNTLGIIFFSLAFGSVLGAIGKRAKPVIDFFLILDECILQIVKLIMWLTPVGVGSVICGKIVAMGDISLIVQQLAYFILAVIAGVFIYQWVILQLIYFLFTRKNPLKFYIGLGQAWFTAFATASTAAALPVSMRCMKENGVDERINRFVLPIGATVNMDGTALFVTIASIFMAQLYKIQLTFGDYVTVVVTSTAVSVAAASVPSAALVLMLMVLGAIDVPTGTVNLLFTIDWFVDRFRTTNNLLGDCYTAAVVEQLSKKELAEMDRLHRLEEEQEALDANEGYSPHSTPVANGKLKTTATTSTIVNEDIENTRF
ncbi:unnamed protein product [Cyprideis torosa]|uniref:Amino acid transporter n=1 Tax=Cyprideis torosa TaxID=163714 RepID=A0A7R8ZPI3_9CRUS|nr:unnamed protein product [Cyprideis torosa]CAG0894016.1 unnamed protein product [Cyprideis torosa]